ncbi:glycine zipper 2TM domain-containing protein [Sandarakinorhabdus sp.]|uniref:glycine zipper 2TM domain-containing protein n=1 Tax=Sandarakinorhabdus sp. TaxID=1916663 RepID=UPI00286D9AF0|nr:YMGG-like glycine zipper-containing protein [Sandarakinorhabdus sp.]
MMKRVFLSAALLAFTPVAAQSLQPAEVVPEMADAVAAAALPPMARDPRLAPTPDDARGAGLPAGWSEAPPLAATPAVQAWQQRQNGWQQGNAPPSGWEQNGWQQNSWQQVGPAPVQVVQVNNVVPVLVPVAYGAYGGGWNRGWNRGWRGGWNRGWNGGWGPGVVIGGGWGGGYNRGYYGRRCRSSGAGALVGSVAGASIGYGLSNPWDRSTGVIIGGLVGALAGSAIERSGRC